MRAIKELVENFNNGAGTPEKQWLIMDKIILEMRRDLSTEGSNELLEFKFPMIVPDISRKHADHRG